MRSEMRMALVILLSLPVGGAAFGQTDAAGDAWDLQRCLDAAQTASPQLAADRARTDAAASGLRAARAALYPALGFSGDYSYVTETMKMSIPTLPGQPARELEFGDGQNADLMLGLQVPLYAGGSLRARRDAAGDRLRAQRFVARADSLDLRLQVRRTFFAALGADAAARAARRGETRLQRHLDEVRSNRQAGVASEEAEVLTRVRLTGQQQRTVLADAQAAQLRLALGRLVGQPDRQIRPKASLEVPLLSGDAATVPWSDRPVLRALDAQLDAGQKDVRAAAGSYRPAVDLQGGWHYGRPGIDAITNDWMNYGTVAVGLRWTLFDFGRRDGQVAGLRAGNRALEHQRDDTDRALRTRLAGARVQHQAAAEAEQRAAERVDLQKKYLELVSSRLDEGFATQREFLDAQDDLTLAEIDLATARAQLRGAEAELLAASGF